MNEVSIPSRRIAYLDVAKGTSILLVILGHNYVKASVPFMGKFIFSFYMPFFFLLSGMLFHQPAQTMTFGYIMRFADNPFIAGSVYFLAAVGAPVIVHQLTLKNNPRLASWFGLRQVIPSKPENVA